jgi:hypothetical protein
MLPIHLGFLAFSACDLNRDFSFLLLPNFAEAGGGD